jgi:hypothetical protein
MPYQERVALGNTRQQHNDYGIQLRVHISAQVLEHVDKGHHGVAGDERPQGLDVYEDGEHDSVQRRRHR